MASFSYLWSRRARFPVGSKFFFRAWGKRLFSFAELLKRNNRRRRLIRKGAVISETAEIGDALVTGRHQHLVIRDASFVGKASIALHGSVQIGSSVCINDGVQILTGSHDVADPAWQHQIAAIVVEDFVWIGTSAIILPGVTLGRGCVVGAGAVVAKSVEPGSIVVGNPAMPLVRRRCDELRYNPCEFLAANRAWLDG